MKNLNIKSLWMIPLLTLLGLLCACEIQEDFKYQPSGVNGNLDMNAWQYIQQSDSLSLLEAAVLYTGLEDLFQADGDARTFIVPNNKAFRMYLKENGYASIEAIPQPILRNLL